jgi:hypothetical protein
MASMYGAYRTVEETIPAIHLLGEIAADCRIAQCRWLLDQPVSNSGKLKRLLREIAGNEVWDWQVELAPDPDRILLHADQIVATSDSQILDGPVRWFNFARRAIESRVPDAWIVDLSS